MTSPTSARSEQRPAVRSRSPSPRHRGAGGTLLGVFVGLVLGLGLAAGVAYYLMRAGSPFPVPAGAKETRDAPRDPAKSTRTDKSDTVDMAAAKPRFEFYKLLPGADEQKSPADAKKSPDRTVADQARERAADKGAPKGGEKGGDKAAEKSTEKAPEKIAAAAPSSVAKAGGRFWLQAGSFTTEADAENLKARLALAGFQANVQPGTLQDKGVRFRVRLGPFDNTDELNRIRSDLTRDGFDLAVIKF